LSPKDLAPHAQVFLFSVCAISLAGLPGQARQ